MLFRSDYPAPVQAGDALGGLVALGAYGNTVSPLPVSPSSTSYGRIQFQATENYTNANNGQQIIFRSVPNQTNVAQTILTISASGSTPGLNLSTQGTGVLFPDGSFQNTAYTSAAGSYISTYAYANVALSSTSTVYIVPIGASYDGARNVSIDGNNSFIFASAGKYQINYSIQFHNPASSLQDVYIWLRQNGSDIANSASIFTVPAKGSGSTPGKLIAITPMFVSANAGDSVQIMMTSPTASGANYANLISFGPYTSPNIPGTPGVITTVTGIT